MPAIERAAIERSHTRSDELTCEICQQPGLPSWGNSVLCEGCYGTLGATCAGRPRTVSKTEEDSAVC